MRIPVRNRLVLLAGVALLAGLVAAAAVLATRGGGSPPAPTARPLAGRPPLVLQLPGPAVQGGNAAVYAAARERLPAGDTRLAVARAVLAYDPGHRDRLIEALQRLPRTDPAVTFALGLAQLWAGQPTVAEATLERVKRLDPFGYYGTNADNLLHLSDEVRGYPLYFPPASGHRPLGALRAAVRDHPRSAGAWLALAAGLERTNRLAALRDARQAASLAPNGVSEQVALAVLGFDKDNPAASVGALGTLASQSTTQTDPQVRFHLGLLFFWIKRPEDAAGEFQQVRTAAPHSIYAPIAGVFQRCMVSQTACLKIAKSG